MPVGRDTISLPLFPLNAVLYPGMRLPLQIFEERQRRLVKDCLERDIAFGVAYIRQGDQTGQAEPHSIGTTARIIQSTVLDDGRYNITVVGVGRFHLLSYRHNGHYLVGQARFLPDLEEEVPRPLIDEAASLGSEYWSIGHGREETQGHPVVPSNPEALSYWIAQYLPLSLPEHQEMLEIRTTIARLSKEVAILRTILDTLRSEQSS